MHLHDLLVYTVKQGASDLHLSADEVPALRINGRIQRLNTPPMGKEDAKRVVYSIMNERQKSQFEKEMEADFSIGIEGVSRFRVNVFNQSRGIAAVFRTIPNRIIPMAQLNLLPVVERIAEFSRGLVLVTGPTGSGKTTTLAALLDHINQTQRKHILTIEDPVEFVHTPAKCIINQRELGVQTWSFDNALRAALREDPDVILVGEMRDLATVQLALTAAETGHLVFGTLHTKGAADTVDRIIDVFPPEQQQQIRVQLAGSLQAVISQTLVERKTGKGRIAATEIMVANFGIRNLIREGKVFQIPSMIQASAGAGMMTLSAHLIKLSEAGMITREAAMEAADDPELFARRGEAESSRSTATRKARR